MASVKSSDVLQTEFLLYVLELFFQRVYKLLQFMNCSFNIHIDYYKEFKIVLENYTIYFKTRDKKFYLWQTIDTGLLLVVRGGFHFWNIAKIFNNFRASGNITLSKELFRRPFSGLTIVFAIFLTRKKDIPRKSFGCFGLNLLIVDTTLVSSIGNKYVDEHGMEQTVIWRFP